MSRLFMTGAMTLASIGFLYGAPIPNLAVMVSTGSATVRHYTATGTLVQTLTGGAGFMTGSVFDTAGNFYVTDFSGNVVKKYDNNAVFLNNTAACTSPESIVFNAAGEFIVGSVGGGIRRFSAAGTLIETDIAGTRVDWIDLAADQQTIYFTQEGRTIQRYNIVTNVAGTTITLPGSGNAYALRLLPAGGLLVADGVNIKRLDAAGSLIQTFDIAGIDDWFALNLDPDGVTFWSAGIASGRVRRFNISTGAVVSNFDAGTDVFGVSVRGEIAVGDGRCDVNLDRRVDSADIGLIMAARNQPASGPSDPRDYDRDGTITVADARACTRICTAIGCATLQAQ